MFTGCHCCCCLGLENCTIEYQVTFSDDTTETRTRTPAWEGDPDFISIFVVDCTTLRLAWVTEVNCPPDPITGISEVYEYFFIADYEWSCAECCQQTIANVVVSGGKDCTATFINTQSGFRNVPEGCDTDENYDPYIKDIEVLSVSCDPDASPCNEFP